MSQKLKQLFELFKRLGLDVDNSLIINDKFNLLWDNICDKMRNRKTELTNDEKSFYVVWGIRY